MDMTTRCAFKIKDPSPGPGRVDFTAPDEGFGLEGTPRPKIQRDPSPPKKKPYMWAAAVFFDLGLLGISPLGAGLFEIIIRITPCNGP